MTVIFANKDPIDLAAIAIMGVSVKVGKNPIGFFGTGVKFAIATLLRTGHEVTLIRNGGTETIQFLTAEENIRGEKFQRIAMVTIPQVTAEPFDGDGPLGGTQIEKLGFTTALGKNWEVWQAYRELRSNCIDEGGVTFAGESIHDHSDPMEFGTIWIIKGPEIDEVHKDRQKIFLETKPIASGVGAEAHPGKTDKVFYRGVRAGEFRGHTLLTYNILSSLTLTEDRTIKEMFWVEHWVTDFIVEQAPEEILEQVLFPPEGSIEHGFSYGSYGGTPSETFMKFCERHRNNFRLHIGALKLYHKLSEKPEELNVAVIDEFDDVTIVKALQLLRRMGVEMTKDDFQIVESLGKGIMGAFRDGRIFIAKETLEQGHRYLASTLYEENLHKEGIEDFTREFQDRVLNKLFMMVDRVVSMEERMVHHD